MFPLIHSSREPITMPIPPRKSVSGRVSPRLVMGSIQCAAASPLPIAVIAKVRRRKGVGLPRQSYQRKSEKIGVIILKNHSKMTIK